MSFSVDERLPGNYFKKVIDAQAEMVRRYLDDLDNPIIVSPYCGNMMMTFKFYSYNNNDDSPHCIILFITWEI